MKNKVNKLPVLLNLLIFSVALSSIIWLSSCNSANQTSTNLSSKKFIKEPSNNIDTPYYEIIKKDTDNVGITNGYTVYVKKENKVKEVNKFILAKYKSPLAVTFTIWYFDNKKIAQNYDIMLNDRKTSDKVIDKMTNHMIGHYEWLKSNGSEDFYIGKNAIDH